MGMEIIIIALLVLLLFGGKRMPEVLRDLGKAQRALQRARDEVMDAVARETTDAAAPSPSPRRETEDGLLKADSSSAADSATSAHESSAPVTPFENRQSEIDNQDSGFIPPEYAEFATLSPAENAPAPESQAPAGEQEQLGTFGAHRRF